MPQPSVLALFLLATGGLALGAQAPQTEARTKVPRSAPVDVDPARLSLTELDHLGVQLARRTDELLLTPDARVVAEQAALLELPDTGLCRLVDRSFAMGEGLGLSLARGGGAYYSFETRDHSYNCQPDIGLEGGRLRSGFYGGSAGLVVPFGELGLAALPTSAESVPDDWSDEEAAAWRMAWADPGENGQDLRQASFELMRARKDAEIRMGATFLVHRWSDDEQHHLVAVRVVDRDPVGVTLAWRRLHRWRATDTEANGRRPEEIRADVPEGPAWIAELGIEEARSLLSSIRKSAQARLLDVAADVRAAHRGWEEQLAPHGGVGFCRILERGRWDSLLSVRGGGAYVDFETGSNDYNDRPHLDLQQGRFGSGFAGSDEGWFADLGRLDEATMLSVMLGVEPPKAQDAVNAERLRLLLETTPVQEGRRWRLPKDLAASARTLSRMDRIDAVVGRTYVLRTLLYDEADLVIVFTVVDEDEGGLTLFGRVVEKRR